MYKIIAWNPMPNMNGAGFGIVLKPELKLAVAKSGLTQQNIDNWIKTHGNNLLLNHGWTIDPNSNPNTYIRVEWGQWGIEHITVPGNACGLDIDTGIGLKDGEMVLNPHNMDNLRQASVVLAVFTAIMEILDYEI